MLDNRVRLSIELAAINPLDSAGLRAIDECMTSGDLERAQSLLSQVDASHANTLATSYLATRLLFLRQRLDPKSVAQRLSELLRQCPDFPEARSLLHNADAGRDEEATQPGSAGYPFDVFAHRNSEPAPANLAPPSERPSPVAATASVRPVRPSAPPSAPPKAEPVRIVVDTRRISTPAPVQYRSLPPDRLHAGVYAVSHPAGQLKPAPVPQFDRASAPTLSRSSPPPLPSERGELPSAIRASVPPPAPSVPPPALRSDPDVDRTSMADSSDPPRSSSVPSSDRWSSTRLSQRPPSGSMAPPSMRPLPPESEAHLIWSEVEQELVSGEHHPALDYLSQSARQQLSHLHHTDPLSEFQTLAHSAAELLNRSWITHLFLPFDLSLHSLARLEAAMATLCRMQPFDDPPPALVLLLGAYVGETLRLAHRGEWSGTTTSSRAANVRAGSHVWHPFVSVRVWLTSGGSKSLFAEIATGLARPGTLAWQTCSDVKARPLTLWQGDVTAEHLPALARAVQTSPWAVACELLHQSPLDGTVESLDALEQLLRTLAGSGRSWTGKEPWLQRLALLAGSYVGEIIRAHSGAVWADPLDPQSQLGFSLELPTGRIITPLRHVVRRATTQKPLDLELYVTAMLGRAG